MKRPAFVPFDPDALMQRGQGADICIDEVGHTPSGMMLSDLIAATKEPATAAPALEQGPGTSTPLDKQRRQKLGKLARGIWQRLHKLGAVTETCDDWRHRIATTACGRRISAAVVGDFKLIQAALLHEAGQERAAQQATAKATTTAVDIARHKLAELCRLRSYPESYAEGIARRIFKRPICALTSKQVWAVFYTVNNNGNSRDGKGRASHRFKSLKAKRTPSDIP